MYYEKHFNDIWNCQVYDLSYLLLPFYINSPDSGHSLIDSQENRGEKEEKTAKK